MPLTQTVEVKSETDSTFTLAGRAVVFGGEDLQGDFFTKDSDFWLESMGTTKPLLYQHGQTKALKKRIIGTASLEVDDEGVFFKAEIDKAARYAQHIRKLADMGLLGSSTGSVPHLVERKAVDGKDWLESWPIAELSLATVPIEPRTIGVEAVKALAELDVIFADPAPVDETPPTTTTTTDLSTAADAEVKAAPAPVQEPLEATHQLKEFPAVNDEPTQAPVAAVEVTETSADTTNTAIKALGDQIAALTAKLQDEPAVKAGGVALPELLFRTEATPEMKAFEMYMRHGILTGPLKAVDANGNVKAALNETTASQGGYAVPTQYSNELVTPLTNLSYLRRAGARIITFSGTNAVDVPTLTYSAAAVLTSEANPYSEIEPTMGHVAFTPYKYTRIAKASEELAADSRFDLWGQILMPDFAQAFAAAENTAFTSGTGSSQPQGLVYGTSTGVTTASATAITADEVIQTFFALDYKYRDRAIFMMADSTVSYVRRLKDGQGNYLWSPGLNGATSGELLGKTIVTNNSMDAIGASKDVICFFDPFYYVIGVWPGLSMQRLNELYAASGQLGWRAFARFDAHLMLSAGSTKLTTHS